MKIQIDIPKELNKNLKLYKVYNNLVNLQDVVVDILEDFFETEYWKETVFENYQKEISKLTKGGQNESTKKGLENKKIYTTNR